MTDKIKKYSVIAVTLVIGFTIGITALVSNAGEDSDDLKVAIEEQNAEKNELKDKKDTLVEEMEKELSSAKTEEEKEAIKEKFDKEISKVDKEISKIETNISKDEKKYETALKEETKKETQNAPSKNEVKPNTDKKSDSVNKDKDTNKKTETDKKTESDKKVVTNKNESVTPSEKPKEPEKKKVWVVDQEAQDAWDETVRDLENPIKTERFIIYFEPGSNPPHGIDGISEKGSPYKIYEDEELYDYTWRTCIYETSHAGYDIQVTYPTKVIHHPAVPEKGHWEWR